MVRYLLAFNIFFFYIFIFFLINIITLYFYNYIYFDLKEVNEVNLILYLLPDNVDNVDNVVDALDTLENTLEDNEDNEGNESNTWKKNLKYIFLGSVALIGIGFIAYIYFKNGGDDLPPCDMVEDFSTNLPWESRSQGLDALSDLNRWVDETSIKSQGVSQVKTLEISQSTTRVYSGFFASILVFLGLKSVPLVLNKPEIVNVTSAIIPDVEIQINYILDLLKSFRGNEKIDQELLQFAIEKFEMKLKYIAILDETKDSLIRSIPNLIDLLNSSEDPTKILQLQRTTTDYFFNNLNYLDKNLDEAVFLVDNLNLNNEVMLKFINAINIIDDYIDDEKSWLTSFFDLILKLIEKN